MVQEAPSIQTVFSHYRAGVARERSEDWVTTTPEVKASMVRRKSGFEAKALVHVINVYVSLCEDFKLFLGW